MVEGDNRQIVFGAPWEKYPIGEEDKSEVEVEVSAGAAIDESHDEEPAINQTLGQRLAARLSDFGNALVSG